ncbi:hypothetical protein Acsp04_64400 [Actinomadura sp. NBRC 104425]|uniref:WXG100 family type VII secretion target n=1 Tax=Actinomadura sp. NBRC 104425 TaxID=3032204 RepID=UPI0024A405EA|nr:WXG100 family type VII secretion target [Actinomadura sp. NBRC 104425]GLZ16205.1 hypothetical protein Acsp04_64400 [Actinomadura sp. NBRC 104425]
MADESPDYGSIGFTIDLGLLQTTITSVKTEHGNISADLNSVRTKTKNLGTSWNSPAYSSFDDVMKWFDKASGDLLGLLDELIRRLEKSYANYKAAEEANYGNVDTT